MGLHQHRTRLLFLSLVATLVCVRAYLFVFPNADLNFGAYNIHHLFTGLILITLGGIPLALIKDDGIVSKLATVTFGVGLSLALDEWVYLIATDGSDELYPLPVSFWGAVLLHSLACAYIWVLNRYVRRRSEV